MRHANLIDPDGDRLVVHGTSMFLFVTVAGEDGTRTAGGFTRTQLDELLDAVAPSTGGTATEPHPLTPDAITDEMVERAQHKIHLRATRIPAETIRLALVAALTEPPARPEGADLIDALLFDMGVDEKRDEVANYIAARLNVSPKEDR